MLWVKRIRQSNLLIKATNWEFWPFGIIQFPAIIYWLWLSLRARSLVFFSASNPGITMGGMFGESKFEILKRIPDEYVPRSLLVNYPVSASELVQLLDKNALSFPLIFKPDIGERGFMVKRINSVGDVEQYLSKIRVNFIAQELIDLACEFGVFYVRFPDEKEGRVTSVVQKEMLTVTGDGSASLRELILTKPRAKLQWHTLQQIYSHRLDTIIPAGETIELVSIGNHCLGTKFLNANHLITEKLSSTFDRISQSVDGFYFGRYDLRTSSIDHLYEGKIKIMELNGCGAEPAHIYDPEYSLLKAMGELLVHWRRIFQIAMQNRSRGIAFISHPEAIALYRKFKAATK